MDKDHRLEAPHNESLSTIDQLGDRSATAAVYPHAHDEWEGIGLMSGEARAKKQAEDQLRINLTIRKWFPIIGLLIPIPAVLYSVLIAFAAENLDFKQAGILLLPAFAAITIAGYLSYKSIRGVFRIFYNHSIKTTPYLIAHVGLLAIAFQPLFRFAQTFHSGWAVGDVLIVAGFLLGASVLLSGPLLFVWTSRKISSAWKFAIVLVLAAILGAVHVFYTLP